METEARETEEHMQKKKDEESLSDRNVSNELRLGIGIEYDLKIQQADVFANHAQ